MLCFEGIALMLNIFREKRPIPNYRLVPPQSGELQTLKVHPEVRRETGSCLQDADTQCRRNE